MPIQSNQGSPGLDVETTKSIGSNQIKFTSELEVNLDRNQELESNSPYLMKT